MMDPTQVTAPRLSKIQIQRRVDEIRERYPATRELPVNVEDLIDLDLDLDLQSCANLLSRSGTDALILADWKTVLVDLAEFSDPNMTNRLRFSLAHELGHYFLHQDVYRDLSFSTVVMNGVRSFRCTLPRMLSRHLNTGRPPADVLVPLNRGPFSRDINRLTRPLPQLPQSGPSLRLRVRSLRSPAYAISVGPYVRPWAGSRSTFRRAASRVAAWCLLSTLVPRPPARAGRSLIQVR